jgi:hypothetical protein
LRRPYTTIAVATLLALVPHRARALDKQGSAHGGEAKGGDDAGFNVAGSLLFGVSLYNPSYAARPNNTGITLFRYAAHVDVDLIGRKLSIPIDLNMFTDRTVHNGRRRPGVPSEGDVIAGVTSTWDAGPGALELGTRVEHDRPLDESSFTQTYVDARARYLYSLKDSLPGVGRARVDGDMSGWLTLGLFAVNPTYAARPDNSGLALLRYGAHYELSVWHDHVSFGLDATLFTDRRESNPLRPSELDFTPEVIGRIAPFEVHLAYERDMPIDRGGLVQQFVYAVLGYGFDLSRATPEPLETRGTIHSP